MNWDALIRSRLAAGLTGLIVVLVGSLIGWKYFVDPGAPAGVRDVPGTVAEVYERAYVVDLDSGQKVRVLRTIELAKGARVTLKATTYASGKEMYVLTDPGLRPQ